MKEIDKTIKGEYAKRYAFKKLMENHNQREGKFYFDLQVAKEIALKKYARLLTEELNKMQNSIIWEFLEIEEVDAY